MQVMSGSAVVASQLGLALAAAAGASQLLSP